MLSDTVIAEAESVVAKGFVEDLEPIGSGLFKNVYMLPSGSAVLKMMRGGENCYASEDRIRRSFEFEWAMYVMAHRAGSGDLFPDTVLGEDDTYGMYFIQEICENGWCGQRVIEDGYDLGLSDLHGGNVGRAADGRGVILDWGFDWPALDSIAESVLEAVKAGAPLPQ